MQLEISQPHTVTRVAVFSVSQAVIRQTVHLEPRPGQQLARANNKHRRALHAQGIDRVIHWVLEYSGKAANNMAERQASRHEKVEGTQ